MEEREEGEPVNQTSCHFSQTMGDLRRRQWLTHKLFRTYGPGFERARLVDMHPHIASALAIARDSAGWTQYDVSWDESEKGGAIHTDSVARITGHPGMGQAPDRWQPPHRSLIPKGLEGLLITGKPACRFIHYHGTVAAVGHAADDGAPLREVMVSRIQDERQRQGAML